MHLNKPSIFRGHVSGQGGNSWLLVYLSRIGLKRKVVFQPVIFRCDLLVSGRVIRFFLFKGLYQWLRFIHSIPIGSMKGIIIYIHLPKCRVNIAAPWIQWDIHIVYHSTNHCSFIASKNTLKGTHHGIESWMIRLPFAHLLRGLLRHQQGMENSKEPCLRNFWKRWVPYQIIRLSWYVKIIMVIGLYMFLLFQGCIFRFQPLVFGGVHPWRLTSHPCEYMMGCLEDKPFRFCKVTVKPWRVVYKILVKHPTQPTPKMLNVWRIYLHLPPKLPKCM